MIRLPALEALIYNQLIAESLTLDELSFALSRLNAIPRKYKRSTIYMALRTLEIMGIVEPVGKATSYSRRKVCVYGVVEDLPGYRRQLGLSAVV